MSSYSSDSSYEKNITDLHVNIMLSSRSSTVKRVIYPDRESAELASRAAMENATHSCTVHCVTPSHIKSGSKRYKTEPDDDDSSGQGVNVSTSFYKRFLKREGEYKEQLLQKDHEIHYLKAIVRQYRSKAKKARALAMAGIARGD